jgi:hypothetical protein
MTRTAMPSGDSQLARRVEPSVDVVDPRDKVLTIDEVARQLKTSRRTIEKRLRAKTFPIHEIPQIDKKHRWSQLAVDAFLATPRVDSRAGRLRKSGPLTANDKLDALLAKPNRRRPRGAGKLRVVARGR